MCYAFPRNSLPKFLPHLGPGDRGQTPTRKRVAGAVCGARRGGRARGWGVAARRKVFGVEYTYGHAHTRLHAQKHTQTHSNTHKYTQTHSSTPTQIHTNTHTDKYGHTHTNTPIHTQMHSTSNVFLILQAHIHLCCKERTKGEVKSSSTKLIPATQSPPCIRIHRSLNPQMNFFSCLREFHSALFASFSITGIRLM